MVGDLSSWKLRFRLYRVIWRLNNNNGKEKNGDYTFGLIGLDLVEPNKIICFCYNTEHSALGTTVARVWRRSTLAVR